MASAYSRPTEYAAPIPTKDVNLINEVLAAKQQRFDVNTARIEEAVSAVSNADLLREPEKEKLKERLSTLLNQVGQGSKLDLTDNNTARQLQSSVSSVIDDDLLKHIGIARQKKAFDQRIAKLQEEEPDKYNDSNLQNSYYESGLADYMQGKKDSIGALQYNPYYDLNKNLNEPLEKFAKSLGFVKDIDEEGNEYFIRTEKTEELGEEKIKNFIQLRVQQDPRLQKQLQINARAGVGFNMQSAKQGLVINRDSIVKDYEKEKEKIKTQLEEIGNPEVRAELQNELSRLNNGISKLKNKIFDTEESIDSAVTTIYTDSLIDQYAKTYAKKDKTDVKYTNIDKLIKKGLSGKSASAGTVSGVVDVAGTKVVKENIDYEQDAPKITVATIEDKVVKETEILKATMSNSYSGFESKTPEEQEAFIKEKLDSLKNNGFDISATEGMTAEVFNQLKLLDQAQNNLTDTYSAIDREVAPRIKKMYSGIFGMRGNSELKINNLAQTMPVTVALVKQGKTYDKMSDSERKLINSEMALAIADQEGGETAEYLKPYAENQASGIDPKEILPKGVAEQAEKVKDIADASWWRGVGKEVAGGLKYGWNFLQGASLYALPLQREKAKNERLLEQYSDIAQAKSMLDEGSKERLMAGKNIRRELYTEDSELEDLELDDLFGDQDYEDLFGSSFKEILSSAVEKPLESAKENFLKENTIVFNPEIDADEAIVNTLDSVMFEKALQQKTYVPMKGTKFSIMPSSDPSKAIVTYQGVLRKDREDGKSEQKDTNYTTIEIPLEDLYKNPALSNLGQTISKTAGVWEMSAKNPTKFEQDIPYTIPEDFKEAKGLAENFTRKFKNYLTEETEASLLRGNIFPSYRTNYNTASKKIQDPNELNRYTQEVLNNHYKVRYTRKAGEFIPQLYQKPKGVPNAEFEPVELRGFDERLTEDFDIFNYSLLASKIVQSHINELINDYR